MSEHRYRKLHLHALCLYLSIKVLQTRGNHLITGENAEQPAKVGTGKLQIQASGSTRPGYTDTVVLAPISSISCQPQTCSGSKVKLGNGVIARLLCSLEERA